MKRFFFLLLFSVTVLMAKAVGAYPGWVNFRQPDGTCVKLRLMGDENFHWAETEDGYTLLTDSEGFMTLAMPDVQGNLCPSPYRMVDVSARSAQLVDVMQTVMPHAGFSYMQIESARTQRATMNKARAEVIGSADPVVGQRKYLVILMQFPDVRFQKTNNDFYRLLNEVGYKEGGNTGSVHDFYDENSFGQLDLQCDVAGVYTASHNMAYYGDNTNGVPYALAVEALTQASTRYDLSAYDADGNGYIDGVHIVFAGYGEEAGGSADCIWSHESTTTGYFCQINGIKMNKYSCTPELSGNSGSEMSKIGVICHEIGHAFGTMDFYDTNYSTGGNYSGTGMWDVMGSGNWNNNGATPAHFNPYSKIYDFQWSDVADGNKGQNVTLHAKGKDQFVRIDTRTEGEFFLLEYRAKTGFDASLPGHGLMVYRSSCGMSGISTNTINAYHKQQFYPLCANASSALPNSTPSSYGTLNSSSAPFPGTQNKTSLTDATIPSMQDWNGNNTCFPITEITENAATGTVSFKIAGGDDSLYGLQVEESTQTSLALRWVNSSSKDVMLVYNTENVFGTPASRDYSAGATISGGGTVVYVGQGSSYTHTGLSDGRTYYYRLYSRSADSYAWGQPLETSGRTVTGSIRSFPYAEDFESGVLDGGWRQEMVSGTNEWKVQKEWNLTSYVLYYNWDFDKGTRQSARAIMPLFNFTGKQNALLEFDYRNMLIDMRVVYRTSPTDDWHLLKVLNNHYKPGMSNLDAYNSEEHAAVLLPDINSTYEVAFVSDFSWRGNSKSSTEVGTVDNIKVSADFGVYVETQSVAAVASTTAEINFLCYEGTQTVLTRGIEWSTNQSTWTQVTATQNSTKLTLTSLPSSTTIYYRAYAQTNQGKTVGKTLSFKTLEAGIGTGTEDDPILIADASDWNKLKTAVNGGNNMTGLYYALANSITLTNYSLSKEFNGHLDGRDYTIDLGTSASSPLFCILGKNGVVKNLRVECEEYRTGGFEKCSPVTGINYGLVTHCDVRIESLYLTSSSDAAGYSAKNYGIISDCHSYIYLPKENMYNYGKTVSFCNQASVGGICWYNFGLINHCSFDGDMACNNNSDLGGMAAVNYYISDEERGRITNCINRGILRVVMVNNNSYEAFIGGIAATNYGHISLCINEGRMIAIGSGSDNMEGGISAWNCNGSTMKHCLNRASLEISPLTSDASAGGVTGFNDMCTSDHCVSTGDIIVTGNRNDNINAAVGRHRSDQTIAFYYQSNINDPKATVVTSWPNTIQALNDAAGSRYWGVENNAPYLVWEKGEIISEITLNPITRFTSTTIQGSYTCAGDIVECGIEYSLQDEDVWKKTPGILSSQSIEFSLDNLQPATEYTIRAYIKLGNGEIRYSAQQSILTDFASKGTPDDPIIIASTKDLRTFARITNQGQSMPERLIKLTKDLDMHASDGEVWTDLVGAFNGEFDGGGHYIHNMRCVSMENHFGEGLFTDGSSYIHDLHFYDVEMDITRSENSVFYVGTIVGVCDRIERCSVVGKMKFTYGFNSWNSWCSGGGIAGWVYSYAKDCYALVDFDTNWTYSLGGIVGRGLKAERCYYGKLATHTGTRKACGIIGNSYKFSSDPEIETPDCYYQEGTISNNKNGTSMSVMNMKNGTLLSLLRANAPDVWKADINGNQLEDGFPLLANQHAFPKPGEGEEEEPEPGEPDGPGDPIEHPDYSEVDNVLYIADCKAAVGRQITVPVMMNNSGDVAAFEFDLYVPAGMSVAKDSKGKYLIKRVTDRMSYEEEDGVKVYSHTIQSSLKDDCYIKVICTSTNNDIFNGYEGAVATITFDIDADAEPGVYPVRLKNQKLTHRNTRSEVYDEAIANITVVSYTLGDVNDDGEINTGDFVGVVNLILDDNTEDLVPEAADVNEDGEIDTGDCVGIINYVLYDWFVPEETEARLAATPNSPVVGMNDFAIHAGEEIEVAVSLDNAMEDCAALQFDVTLPEGLTLVKTRWVGTRTTSERHSLRTSCLSDNKVRIVGASSGNDTFCGTSGDLLLLKVRADEYLSARSELTIDNIRLARTNTSVVRPAHCVVTVSNDEATGIRESMDAMDEGTVFTIMGTKVNAGTKHRGIYIVNHKKIVK